MIESGVESECDGLSLNEGARLDQEQRGEQGKGGGRRDLEERCHEVVATLVVQKKETWIFCGSPM